MKKWSQLLTAAAPLALLGAAILPAQIAAAPEIRVPGTVPAAEEEPKKPVRIRVPVKIESSEPATIEKGGKIRTPLAIPAADESVSDAPVKTEQAEAKPPPRIRINKPPIDSSTPAEVETAPKLRTRVVKTADDTAAEEPAKVKPKRIGTPKIDQTVPAEVESGPKIRPRIDKPVTVLDNVPNTPIIPASEIAKLVTATCVLPESMTKPPTSLSVGPKNQGPPASSEGGGTNLMELVCMLDGKPTAMTFRYESSKNIYDHDPLSAAKNNHFAGMASNASFEAKSLETNSKGRSIYRIWAVTEGVPSLRKVACAANGRDNDNSLTVLPRDPEEGPIYTTWCGDGTTVFPVSFKLNSLISYNGSAYSASTVSASKAFAYVEYESATSSNEAGPFLVRKILPSSTWDSQKEGGFPKLIDLEFKACRMSGNQVPVKDCVEYDIVKKGPNWLRFNTHIPSNIKAALGPSIDNDCVFFQADVYDDNEQKPGTGGPGPNKYSRFYDYKRTTCTNNHIYLALLPGIVEKKNRSKASGACYIGMIGRQEQEVVVKFTYSRRTMMVRDQYNSPYYEMEPDFGISTGIAGKLPVVNAPC